MAMQLEGYSPTFIGLLLEILLMLDLVIFRN